jgi:hypothetical protein
MSVQLALPLPIDIDKPQTVGPAGTLCFHDKDMFQKEREQAALDPEKPEQNEGDNGRTGERARGGELQDEQEYARRHGEHHATQQECRSDSSHHLLWQNASDQVLSVERATRA